MPKIQLTLNLSESLLRKELIKVFPCKTLFGIHHPLFLNEVREVMQVFYHRRYINKKMIWEVKKRLDAIAKDQNV